jgi:Mrp family chromosome partitioning ATPase
MMRRASLFAVRQSHSLSQLSRREMASLEDRIIRVAATIEDPVLESDLRSLGWTVKRVSATPDGTLELHLTLPTLMHPQLEQLKEKIRERVLKELGNALNDVPDVKIQTTASQPFPVVARRVEEHSEILKNLGPGLANVAHFLAVYSCKGGVGKSTVAVNLAYELARLGGRVGLLDVDIYGPSLPVLIKPDDAAVRRSSVGRGMVYPIDHKGVKLLSLGYVSPQSGVPGSGADGGAAVMRGPMAGRVVTQLLKGTDWGELDVLVLDLPPGTGDVQLAICQDLELSGAVAVTTPSKLAATDARKGISMFTSLGVPTMALVENMSYFVCPGGDRHYPFGKGIDNSDIETPNVFRLPLSTVTNDANDAGSPVCVLRPISATDELGVFGELASSVARELLQLQHGRSLVETSGGIGGPSMVAFAGRPEKFDVATVHLSVGKSQDNFSVRLFSDSGATQLDLAATELRQRHPKTGELLDEDDESTGQKSQTSDTAMVQHHQHGIGTKATKLVPAKIEKKGRYGYAVEWADGATIIYSMLSIAKAAGGNIVQ